MDANSFLILSKKNSFEVTAKLRDREAAKRKLSSLIKKELEKMEKKLIADKK
jgi:hypothetical protein